MSDPLGWAEAVVDRAQIAEQIEARLPSGGRPRQLPVRTLLIGMLLAIRDGRPAHLVRVHRALVGLAPHDRCRLGVEVTWHTAPHLLTYRQVERTFGLVTAVDTDTLAGIIDALVEASIPDQHKTTSTSYAVDWTDLESWGRPPTANGQPSADPDASWGHRSANHAGTATMFYGYYLQAITIVRDEHAPPVPELVRRITLAPCHHDPPRQLVPVIARMITAGSIDVGDVLADSGYAHRAAHAWALPLRQHGVRLIQDLHPHDRGPKGTHAGAIAANGNLYCPATPPSLLTLAAAPPHATPDKIAELDTKTAEAARYKLGRITTHDADGYHRVCCPAVTGKLRCPLRPDSMSLGYDHPEILTPPDPAPRCCTQQTVTVPPDINAKTAQKHDYPSATWRRSYTRRTAAERRFSTVKDPATTNIRRGWCRLMGTPALTLFIACAFIVRNERVAATFEQHQADDTRRAANGMPPRTRRRRRRTISELVATPP